MQYSPAVFSRLEASSDVVSGRLLGPDVSDKLVKFCDPRLKLSREIPFEVVGAGIFDVFFAITSDRKQLGRNIRCKCRAGRSGCPCKIR